MTGRCVARHERCYSRQQQVLDLEHYLDVLSRKPGALAGSTAAGAATAGRSLAEEFRRDLASVDDALRQTDRHQTHDRDAEAIAGSLVVSTCAGRDRYSAGNGLHGYRGSAASGAREAI